MSRFTGGSDQNQKDRIDPQSPAADPTSAATDPALRDGQSFNPCLLARTFATASAHILLNRDFFVGAGIMADQQQLVEQLFDAALAIKAGERHAFLERVCGADLDLRRSVEYLLVKDPRAGSPPPRGFREKPLIDIRADIHDRSQTRD